MSDSSHWGRRRGAGGGLATAAGALERAKVALEIALTSGALTLVLYVGS